MITVDKTRRFLLKEGGFYPYLADTAWTAAQRLSKEELLFYLDKRKAQGFNAVQFSAISELDGINVPTRQGYLPFEDGNPEKPSAEYFEWIRFIVEACEERGITAVLLPYWGDKFNKKWGVGPEIFTPDNVGAYAELLARTVGDSENIIWLLGGDRPIETERHRRIIDETAAGLKHGEAKRHLITYHPNGESGSVDFLCGCPYIDFHTVQSGHSFGGYKSDEMIKRTLALERKPCIDFECFYEDFPIDFNIKLNYRFSDLDIRRRMYKNMMSGAAGHTYGHQSVWCFKTETDGEYQFDWKSALDRPMANQMKYITRLLKVIDITTAVPVEISGLKALESDSFLAFYLESPEPAFADWKTERHFKSTVWYNTKEGIFKKAGDFSGDKQKLQAPFQNDAVLICFK